MSVFILCFVVLAVLFAIGSGVWVAAALVKAISGNPDAQTKSHHPKNDADSRDI
jgi:hypothetical protein